MSTETFNIFIFENTNNQPGQFISLRLFLPELKLNQIRQYSLSCAPNDEYYRISVKRETGPDIDANGMISNRLHDHALIGSHVELTSPSGNFVIPEDLNSPVVFISGGVGLTPFMSMISHLANKGTKWPIAWLHGCRNQSVHAFKDHLDDLVSKHDNIQQHIFYNTRSDQDIENGVYEGHLDINSIKQLKHAEENLYFVCGPSKFIIKQIQDLKDLGVDSSKIFFEEFGPQNLQLN